MALSHEARMEGKETRTFLNAIAHRQVTDKDRTYENIRGALECWNLVYTLTSVPCRKRGNILGQLSNRLYSQTDPVRQAQEAENALELAQKCLNRLKK